MSQTVLSVPNISCGHCVSTIQRELTTVPGVEAVVADRATKQVTLTYRDERALQAARQTLEEIGYPAQ